MKITPKEDGTLELRIPRGYSDDIVKNIYKSNIKFIDGYALIMLETSKSDRGESQYHIEIVDTDYRSIFSGSTLFLGAKLLKGRHLITYSIEQKGDFRHEQYLNHNLNWANRNDKPINMQCDIDSGSFSNYYWKECNSDQVVLIYAVGGGLQGIYDPTTSRIIDISKQYTTIGNFQTVSDKTDEKFALATRRIYYSVGNDKKHYDISFYIDETGKIRTRAYDEFKNQYLSFSSQSEYASYFEHCGYYAAPRATNKQAAIEKELLMEIKKGKREE